MADTVSRMHYVTTVDRKNAALRSEAHRVIFGYGLHREAETNIIQFKRGRMMVASPIQDLCLKYDLKDISPISLSHDEDYQKVNHLENLLDALTRRWKYLGVHTLT
jgi:hypothetical protein